MEPRQIRGLRTPARITLALGILTLLAVAVSHLALTDIRHGEGSLVGEWWALRVAFAVIVLFAISTLVTLGRLLRRLG